ncbi:cnnm4 [Symbiodinium pilosum]|uniref:Cnnm4 protein n=1 Tax=Symbiodinium pilosum TaxID=2952 RepID=A0A812KYL0_SYMPI|nr:cnnm4 [Symbiodinium pilosum]
MDDAIGLHFKAARQHQELLHREVLQQLQSVSASVHQLQGTFVGRFPAVQKLSQEEDVVFRSLHAPSPDECNGALSLVPTPVSGHPPPPPLHRVASLPLGGVNDSRSPQQTESFARMMSTRRQSDAKRIKLATLNQAVQDCLLTLPSNAAMPSICDQSGFRWMSGSSEILLTLLRIAAVSTFCAIVIVRILVDVRGVSFHFLAAVTMLYSIVGVHCVRQFKRAMHSESMKLADQQLGRFAHEFELDCHWSSAGGVRTSQFIVVWLLMVMGDVVQHIFKVWNLDDSDSDSEIGRLAAHAIQAVAATCFMVYSALVVLTVISQARCLAGLNRMLDCWCNDLLSKSNFAAAAQSWNVMQASIKSVAQALSRSFLILQSLASVGFCFLLGGTAGMSLRAEATTVQLIAEAASAFPLLFLFLASLILMSRAAALTEKCRSIPTFINQIPSDRDLDPDRQYLCRYVADSSTGFIIFGVTITQELFLKQVYFLGTLLSGICGVLVRAYM